MNAHYKQVCLTFSGKLVSGQRPVSMALDSTQRTNTCRTRVRLMGDVVMPLSAEGLSKQIRFTELAMACMAKWHCNDISGSTKPCSDVQPRCRCGRCTNVYIGRSLMTSNSVTFQEHHRVPRQINQTHWRKSILQHEEQYWPQHHLPHESERRSEKGWVAAGRQLLQPFCSADNYIYNNINLTSHDITLLSLSHSLKKHQMQLYMTRNKFSGALTASRALGFTHFMSPLLSFFVYSPLETISAFSSKITAVYTRQSETL